MKFLFLYARGKEGPGLPTALLHAYRVPVAESHFFMICCPQLSFLSSVTPR